MSLMSLKHVDLNLLITFDALWHERNVTRAARRLNVSQPTVSNALSRLRLAFGDQLFLRAPRGIEPTERCSEIIKDVREALRHIEQALDSGPAFDAKQCRREFHIGCADYFDLFVLPDLLAYMAEHAPMIDLRLRSVDIEEGMDLLDAGELDFMMHMEFPAAKRFGVRPVLHERHVFATRAGHPLVREAPDIATFASLSHVNFSQRGDSESPVDEVLARLGYRRRVAITTQHMTTVAHLVKTTDLVASVPSRMAARMVEEGGFAVYPIPFQIEKAPVAVYWNRRFELDGAMRWMRDAIIEFCEVLEPVTLPFDTPAATKMATASQPSPFGFVDRA
ncbi:transcriptional regulator, LysR family [Maricaulis maris MCS10]|uniref:Transcriptional regulator, LysR family n=2 Tax=Maricaulis maris TaxID=74318 RepID=Q0ARX0_MARMM|nr:transcriptional regulator, LysR family [Maricaulis maris MCS10]